MPKLRYINESLSSNRILWHPRVKTGAEVVNAAESQSVSAATEEQLASMEEIATSSQALANLAQDLQTAAKFQI